MERKDHEDFARVTDGKSLAQADLSLGLTLRLHALCLRLFYRKMRNTITMQAAKDEERQGGGWERGWWCERLRGKSAELVLREAKTSTMQSAHMNDHEPEYWLRGGDTGAALERASHIVAPHKDVTLPRNVTKGMPRRSFSK